MMLSSLGPNVWKSSFTYLFKGVVHPKILIIIFILIFFFYWERFLLCYICIIFGVNGL